MKMSGSASNSAVAVLLVFFLVPAVSSAQARLDVRLFGHRGYTRSAPENSLAALEAAAILGLAGAEIDPRLRLSINLRACWQIEGLATFARTALDADALFAHEFYFPRFGFQEAARTGAEIQVYVPGVDNLIERFRRAAGIGANVVSSDYPELLVPLVVAP